MLLPIRRSHVIEENDKSSLKSVVSIRNFPAALFRPRTAGPYCLGRHAVYMWPGVMTILIMTCLSVRPVVANKSYSSQMPVFGSIKQADRVVFYELAVLANKDGEGSSSVVDALQIQ